MLAIDDIAAIRAVKVACKLHLPVRDQVHATNKTKNEKLGMQRGKETEGTRAGDKELDGQRT